MVKKTVLTISRGAMFHQLVTPQLMRFMKVLLVNHFYKHGKSVLLVRTRMYL